MEPTNEVQNILEGKPKAVDVAAIERELKALWKEAAAAPAKDGQAVMRACVLNLVVYMGGAADSENVIDAIGEVTLRHPSRTIIVTSAADATESDISAWVVARCHLVPGGRKQVCSEQVMISAKGKNLGNVPSTVLPLLLPDLPVFLWWRDRLVFGSELFERLVDTSDRVVVDSSLMMTSEASLAKLAHLATTWSRSTALSDLSWSRLTPWRALIAGFYDVPDFRLPLARLSRVVIDYNASGAGSQTPAQAFLIAGWLASRLKWQPAPNLYRMEKGSHFLNLKRDDQNITIELRPSASGGGGTELVSVKLVATSEPAALFVVSKTEDGLYLQTEADMPEMHSVLRVVPLEPATEAWLISQELDILGQDRVYSRALELAGKFASASSCMPNTE